MCICTYIYIPAVWGTASDRLVSFALLVGLCCLLSSSPLPSTPNLVLDIKTVRQAPDRGQSNESLCSDYLYLPSWIGTHKAPAFALVPGTSWLRQWAQNMICFREW